MRNLFFMSLMLCATLLLGAEARAQAPAPAQVPEAMPYDIPFGRPITLEHAKKIAAAAQAEARKHNWKMAIAVVEPSGDLVYFEKMDGTQYASIKIAQGKAHAAAIFRRPTKIFADAANSGHPYVLGLEGAVTVDGGLPLVENGKIIGAIGASGGTSEQDAVVAKAGLDTIK